jgi:hypothetical protein
VRLCKRVDMDHALCSWDVRVHTRGKETEVHNELRRSKNNIDATICRAERTEQEMLRSSVSLFSFQ